MSQESAELLCARIEGANREASEGTADLSSRSVLFLRGPATSGEHAIFVGRFLGMHRAYLGG